MATNNFIFFTAIFVFFTSCNTKPAPTPTQTTPAPTAENPGIPQNVSTYPAPGIVFGQNVRLRADSSLQGREMAKVSTGENLVLLQATGTLYTIGNDTLCDSYPMVLVKTESGKTGWIHGKFVFRIQDKFEQTDGLEPISLAGQEFRLKAGQNYGPGASDQDGLTGCWAYSPLLLLDNQTGKHYPVALNDPDKSIPNFPYFNLESDEGGSDRIVSLKVLASQTIRLEMERELMEGCIRYTVDLERKDGQFVGKYFNVRRQEEGGCE